MMEPLTMEMALRGHARERVKAVNRAHGLSLTPEEDLFWQAADRIETLEAQLARAKLRVKAHEQSDFVRIMVELDVPKADWDKYRRKD